MNSQLPVRRPLGLSFIETLAVIVLISMLSIMAGRSILGANAYSMQNRTCQACRDLEQIARMHAAGLGPTQLEWNPSERRLIVRGLNPSMTLAERVVPPEVSLNLVTPDRSFSIRFSATRGAVDHVWIVAAGGRSTTLEVLGLTGLVTEVPG